MLVEDFIARKASPWDFIPKEIRDYWEQYVTKIQSKNEKLSLSCYDGGTKIVFTISHASRFHPVTPPLALLDLDSKKVLYNIGLFNNFNNMQNEDIMLRYIKNSVLA